MKPTVTAFFDSRKFPLHAIHVVLSSSITGMFQHNVCATICIHTCRFYFPLQNPSRGPEAPNDIAQLTSCIQTLMGEVQSIKVEESKEEEEAFFGECKVCI